MLRLLKVLFSILFLITFSVQVLAIQMGNLNEEWLQRTALDIKNYEKLSQKVCREALLSKDKQTPAFFSCMALANMRHSKWQLAADNWIQAISVSKDHAEQDFYIGLASAYEKLKMFPEALDTINRALKVWPSSISLYYWSTVVREKSRKRGDQKKIYRKISSLKVDEERSLEFFYQAYSIIVAENEQKLPLAQQNLEKLIIIMPAHFHAKLLLGLIYLKTGKPKIALSVLKSAEILNRDHLTLQLLLSQAYLIVEKPDDSIFHAKMVLDAMPDHIVGNYLIGMAYLKKGELDKGINYLENASVDVNFEPAKLLLGTTYAVMGKTESAINTLEELAKLNTMDLTSRIALANLYIKMGKADNAIELCNQILQKNPKNIRLLYIKASALLTQSKTKEAEQLFTRIIKETPNFYHAKIQMIRLYAVQGKFDRALNVIDDLIQKNPNDDLGYAIKGDLAFAKGESLLALKAYLKAVAINPDSTFTWKKILQLYLENDQLSEAQNAADALIEKHPRFSEAYLTDGIVCLRRGDLDKASSFFHKVLELDEYNYKALNYLGIINSEKNRDAAIQAYEKSLEIYPQQMIIYRQLAGLYIKSKNKEGVLRTAKHWALIYPEQGEPYETMAMIAAGEKKFDQAIRQFEKAISVEPDQPSFYLRLGSLYNSLGLDEKATSLYEKALKYIPNDPIILNNLSCRYAIAGRLEEGLIFAEKAEGIAPDDWNIKDTIGQIYCQLGNYVKAIHKYNEALIISKENQVIQYRLGKAYLAMGDTSEALKYLRLVNAGASTFAKKNEVKELVKSLEKDNKKIK